MKGWLLDQNPPARLTFVPSRPVTHATELGPSPSDSEIWRHAREFDLVILTKDADFSGRIVLATPPPRVVHLKFGNLRRGEFHARLATAWTQIEALVRTHKLVNVYADRIEAMA